MTSAVIEAMAAQSAVIEAHETFLRFSTTTQENLAHTLALQTELLSELLRCGTDIPVCQDLSGKNACPPLSDLEPPRSLSFEQCQMYAVGSIAAVLGPRYAQIDQFPTRVRTRWPAYARRSDSSNRGRALLARFGPCCHRTCCPRATLVSRRGRIPTCIAVEAGQADLFLSGYLGIDFLTRGLAVYRLLDAAVTFHRPLPGIGAVIRYDIHIDNFFRQGNTHLFRFRFESTVNGEPLLSMSEGCARVFH